MHAGQLRERVRIEARARTPDGEGGEVEGWDTSVTPRSARIRPMAGGEAAIGERLQGRMNYEITLRYSSDTADITSDMRAVDDRTGTIYAIKTVNHDERRRWMFLMVQKGAPA